MPSAERVEIQPMRRGTTHAWWNKFGFRFYSVVWQREVGGTPFEWISWEAVIGLAWFVEHVGMVLYVVGDYM